MDYPRVILAGTHSSVGKTTIALGIILALKKRNLNVQPFKIGPDYIDPSLHTQASGANCYNLDSWLVSRDRLLELFKVHSHDKDISVIEGVMGLYDGLRDTEDGSTAQVAKILGSPVILILDARSLSRSAAAIVLGYKKFDKRVGIRGIILNNIGSDNHYISIKNSIESKVGIGVIGFLPKENGLKLESRHLGLIPARERELEKVFYKKLLNLVEAHIDMDKIINIAKAAEPLPYMKRNRFVKSGNIGLTTIAVARDKAFNFYYEDNLDILKDLGCNIVEFSPISDKKLPDEADGIYIGGGFPELFAEKLAKNTRLKECIFKKSREGMPIFAECGGLMYLVQRLIDFKGRSFSMVGIFEGSVRMDNRLRALGYAEVETIKDNILSKRGDKNRAHIFHWSYLDNLSKKQPFAYKISKPTAKCRMGNSECRMKKDNSTIYIPHSAFSYDGLLKGNTLASYAHLHLPLI